MIAVCSAAAVLAAWVDRSETRHERAALERQAVAMAGAFCYVARSDAPTVMATLAVALGPKAELYLMDREGRVVASHDPPSVGLMLEDAVKQREPALKTVLTCAQAVVSDEMWHAGEKVFDVMVAVRDPAGRGPCALSGALHLATPRAAVTAAGRKGLAVTGAVLAAMLLGLMVPLMRFFRSEVLAPIELLARMNDALSAGGLEDARIPLASMPDHEIGHVMRSRNAMLDRILDAETTRAHGLRELSDLQASAGQLSDSVDVDAMLERSLVHIVAATEADAGQIAVLDESKGNFSVQASLGFSEAWCTTEEDRPVACMCGDVLASGVPLAVADVARDPRCTRSACTKDGFHGYAGIPLRVAGRVIGLVSLHHRAKLHPSPHLQDLLGAIGNQVGIALLNARLYERTLRLATTDTLTGVGNRRTMMARLEDALALGKRHGVPTSLLMLDLDHFKAVNDQHGHASGDAVLVELAVRLRGAVRGTDVIARFGGEEFLLVLPHTPKEGAMLLAGRVLDAIRSRPFAIPGSATQLAVTASAGVATVPGDATDVDSALRAVDDALYRAKRLGRDRCEPAEPTGESVDKPG